MTKFRSSAIVWRGSAIPPLVLGTAQLGLPGYGVANKADAINQQRVDAIVKAAWESGVRFFDTAQAYGHSEERLGAAFRNLCLNNAGDKSGPHIVTKLAPEIDRTDTKAIAASLDSSLVRLGQKRLWGVMLHGFDWLGEWDNGPGDTLKAFRELGGTKYLGVSVYGAKEALTAIQHPDMDIIQIPANAWDGRMLRAGIFERAREQDKLLFVRSVFLQGLLLLSPEEAEAKVPGAGRPAGVWAELCRRQGYSSMETALGWAAGLHCPLVIGTETPEQTREIARVLGSLDKQSCNVDVLVMQTMEQETVITPFLWRK